MKPRLDLLPKINSSEEKNCLYNTKSFYEKIEPLTDRELAEYNTYLNLRQTRAVERIVDNVLFFFYVTIIPMIIGGIIVYFKVFR